MGLWRDEVAVLFVRQVTAQALPYVKPALKRPACCIIVITVTKSQAAQIKPITAHHANQLYQHGTLALLVPGLLEGTTTIGELLTHGDTGIGTGEGDLATHELLAARTGAGRLVVDGHSRLQRAEVVAPGLLGVRLGGGPRAVDRTGESAAGGGG